MDDNQKNILNGSNQTLSRLQLLSVFFQNEIVYKIYLQSQVIHRLFANNPELDINKLELFHVQYTESVIELLKRVKKSNEKNVSLLQDEIQVNKDLVANLSSGAFSEKEFNAEKVRQAMRLSISLKKVYRVLSEDSDEYPFSTNLAAFSATYAENFFAGVPAALFNELLQYEASEVYSNANVTIHRKLLGSLLKHEFRISFEGGFKAGRICMELYAITGTDKMFLFSPSGGLFLFCDPAKLAGIDKNNTLSKNARISQELLNKNVALEARAQEIKTFLPPELTSLFTDYYNKISNIDFLQDIMKFDVEANILKAMLNTNSF